MTYNWFYFAWVDSNRGVNIWKFFGYSDDVIKIIQSGVVGEIFNISGNFEESNLTIAKKIIKIFTGSEDYNKYIDFSWKRPGQDVRYSINDTKLRGLGWVAEADFDIELHKIVQYYKQNFVW